MKQQNTGTKAYMRVQGTPYGSLSTKVAAGVTFDRRDLRAENCNNESQDTECRTGTRANHELPPCGRDKWNQKREGKEGQRKQIRRVLMCSDRVRLSVQILRIQAINQTKTLVKVKIRQKANKPTCHWLLWQTPTRKGEGRKDCQGERRIRSLRKAERPQRESQMQSQGQAGDQ